MIEAKTQEGDKSGGLLLGYKSNTTHMYVICPICKKGHWVRLNKGRPRNVKCIICAAKENIYFNTKGNKNPRWNGGKWKNEKGYILIFVDEKSPYVSMRKKDNHVYEHRLVMAKYLGRPLNRWEVVHHINHIRNDNRIENLELYKKPIHQAITILEEENKRLRKQIEELKSNQRGD